MTIHYQAPIQIASTLILGGWGRTLLMIENVQLIGASYRNRSGFASWHKSFVVVVASTVEIRHKDIACAGGIPLPRETVELAAERAVEEPIAKIFLKQQQKLTP